ncbi:Protein with response regulator receiver domain [Desulfatibacillum aliphaticivorans]|uniref:Protein with response regulator receiver domain n=1 Tax=Desulfatibacillum aliphaticivorans TaxID=218208 RepID=B8FH55_DESAL|nr:response regulator [Desulfatibacillum aliphaticivorans]ACL02143.1 Protein with response regulator receiver domain [Desulfatibacillum aliphaticivorans]
MGQPEFAERILVIDDNKDFADTLVEQLDDLGYSAQAVYDGAQGMEAYSKGEYALVITDLSMPGLDGMDVLEGILAQDSKATILMVTGYGTIETAVQAIKLGAFDFIPKPFKLAELEAIIRRAFGRKDLEKQFSIFRGLAWGLAICIPIWIALGYFLYKFFIK